MRGGVEFEGAIPIGDASRMGISVGNEGATEGGARGVAGVSVQPNRICLGRRRGCEQGKPLRI